LPFYGKRFFIINFLIFSFLVHIILESVNIIELKDKIWYDDCMEITKEQFDRIASYLPRQRGNVRMSNLQFINAILYYKCDIVCHGKRLQMEGVAEILEFLRVMINLILCSVVSSISL